LLQAGLPVASSSDGRPPEAKTVEITLLDWGSLLQVKSIQTLAGYSISPTFPEGISSLPTLLFIGDSITSGYVSSPSGKGEDEYSGFVDAYPSQLKTRLSNNLRLSAIAFPGIKLVDSPGEEGMESQWFKTHPLEDGSDWDFAERDSESGPTHIFVNLGTNDDTPTDKFLETYEGFLSMLKETHGRRTGDIIVLAPFGSWSHEQGKYIAKYPELGDMVGRMQEKWANEDPFGNGDFPSTPMLELAKMHLESPNPSLHRISPAPSHASLKQLVRDQSQSSKLNDSGLPMPAGPDSGVMSPRPSLLVRPSSIAAVTELAKGTKARLHFADTQGWLDSREDTFDGLHPTRKGAAKIGKRLARWLAKEGFLKD
jgi:lysophospholipase L1-like esterase